MLKKRSTRPSRLTSWAQFLFIFPLFWAFSVWGTLENTLQEANASYLQGEKATSFEERKRTFNRALSLYHLIEEEKGSNHSTLNRVIGDSYFQLEEYVWAVLYYERALKEDPHQAILISRLGKAQEKLGIPPSLPLETDQHPVIHALFTLSQKFWVFGWIFFLSFVVCSLAIWLSYSWIRKLAVALAVLVLLLLGNGLFFYYSNPIEAILVTSTGFYRAPDWNQPQLIHLPLPAGSKVQILEITPEGKWVKVENSSNVMGYIPINSLRLI